MKLIILDKRTELNATCYLCKIDLVEYISSIHETYRSFEIQRGIVSNRYLDRLASTIAKKGHIPSIVLVANEFKEVDSYLDIIKFEILDGLQRSHRLKIIWEVLGLLLVPANKKEVLENTSKFCRSKSEELRRLGGDIKIVRNLIDLNLQNFKKPEEFFEGATLWIEVWVNLSQSEQVEKMLLLNAGHKSVNIKHQLELLFLGTLLKLEDIAPPNVEFVREKTVSAITYSKTRRLGQYHFAHIISSLVALSAGKIVNTNADYISDLQANQEEYIELVDEFSLDFMAMFIDFLFELDKQLQMAFGDIGTKWLGREVVLIGIFASIGSIAIETNVSISLLLNKLKGELPRVIGSLELNNFESVRNNLELNKINIGNVNKKAVYLAFKTILKNETFLGWDKYFGGES